jgi:hypothetical protein
VGAPNNDELARRLGADIARLRRPHTPAPPANDVQVQAAVDELTGRLGADIARLRRLHTSASPAQDVRAPEAEEVLEVEESPEAEHSLDEVPSAVPQEVTIQAHPVREPGVMTETERRALFVALSAGTERHLGRKPTAGEFVRLCDALVMARQLAMVERHLFYGGMEIHWDGSEWTVEDTSQTEDRRAAIQTWTATT